MDQIPTAAASGRAVLPGVGIGVPWVAVALRLLLMVVGTVAALVFLLRNPQGKSHVRS